YADPSAPSPSTDLRLFHRHWQLRHYISAPEEDLLYYASGKDVYCLNTSTKKRKHITTLPFEARCTASGHGWVCIGGEDDGLFAAIKLSGALDVDAALPIEGWRQSSGHRTPTVKVERIGEEIVNSISVHRIQDEEAHLDDIVAVLTNNDNTVRIYSLPQGLETRVKDLPFAINHATISPDGTTLVAVGDYNQAYFFTREILDAPPQIPKPHNRLTSASLDWTLTNVVTLHSNESTCGYFTTAWSPSGHLVALGSEGGYVTILDADILADPECEDDEAVVAVVAGSRADLSGLHPGAIRTMMFSPEPWNLFIWAEDQGRICIGDLRTGLKSRQVINLDPKDESLERLEVEDLPSENATPSAVRDDLDELDLLRRYRSQVTDGYPSPVHSATEWMEVRRRQREQRQRHEQNALRRSYTGISSSRHASDAEGLTRREQQILESLRTSRQREEARANGQSPSTTYTSADMFNASGDMPTSTTSSTADLPQPISEILASAQESMPALSRTHAATERPPSSHAAESPTTFAQVHSIPEASWAARRPTSNFRQPAQSSRTAAEDDDENPWRLIEEHMPARGPLFEGAARARAAPPLPEDDLTPEELQDVEREIIAERRLAAQQARTRERWRTSRLGAVRHDTSLRRVPVMRFSAIGGGREIGVRTAGLAISPDGRVLWAACEEGIFEVKIKVKGRMFWPAVEMR
ncbi:uncharacterized protein MYCGRDRAFT_40145, partial [Zymoseptoria tritici IPO323]